MGLAARTHWPRRSVGALAIVSCYFCGAKQWAATKMALDVSPLVNLGRASSRAKPECIFVSLTFSARLNNTSLWPPLHLYAISQAKEPQDSCFCP
jgi:hypothetical protein